VPVSEHILTVEEFIKLTNCRNGAVFIGLL
jgi:hypothetical protein